MRKFLALSLLLLCGLVVGASLTARADSCHAHKRLCSTTTTSPTTSPTTTASTTVDATTTVTTTTAPVTYLFDDEFSGAAGAPPDPTKWWTTPWCSSSPDDSFGCYSTANAFTDGNGHLVLRVSLGTTKTYNFARVQTFQEGSWPPTKILWSANPPIRVEVRAKYAPGAGLWEGVWGNGMTSNSLELDTEEFRGAVPTQDTCHTHGPVSDGATIDTGMDLSAAFHNYWEEYYTDHVVFGIDSLTCGSMVTPAQPMAIRLSNVVGPIGTWGGLDGPPPASSILADMLVDYVRVTPLP